MVDIVRNLSLKKKKHFGKESLFISNGSKSTLLLLLKKKTNEKNEGKSHATKHITNVEESNDNLTFENGPMLKTREKEISPQSLLVLLLLLFLSVLSL